MSSTRRAIGFALPITVLMLLALAPTALAKEGTVLLDTAQPTDPPGTTVEIGFVVTLPGPDGQDPQSGANAFVRVRSASGTTLVAWATEQPAGSGHYAATFAVPAGGIQRMDFGLAEPGCTSNACANDGFMLQLADQPSGFGKPAPAVNQPQPRPQSNQPTPPVSPVPATALILAAGIVVVAGVAVATRRGLLPLRRGARST